MFITYDADRHTDDQRRYAFWGTGYEKEFENSRFNPILTATIGTQSPNCTDPPACNYNQPLTKEKPVCWYREKHKDCFGRCIGNFSCDGVCGGEMKEDACGVCGGSKEDKKDCPKCADGIVLDCAGKCGGTSTKDKCGICKDWDNDKEWQGKAGNSCTGCKSENACNAFTGHKFHDPKMCEFPTKHFNCKKECISEIDCESVCGGTARLNKCNMCNRPDSACPTGMYWTMEWVYCYVNLYLALVCVSHLFCQQQTRIFAAHFNRVHKSDDNGSNNDTNDDNGSNNDNNDNNTQNSHCNRSKHYTDDNNT